jgi:cytochrome P450
MMSAVKPQLLQPNQNPAQHRAKKDAQFMDAMDRSLGYVSEAIFMGDAYKLGLTKDFYRVAKICHDYVDQIIHRAIEKRSPFRGDQATLLETLLEQKRAPAEIRSHSMALMVAGRDTTAALLSFVLLVLARQPEIYQKLRAQVLEHFGTYRHSRDITFSSLKACYYLRWCLHETLRLYPIFPVNARKAVRDTTLPTGGGPDGQSPIFIARDEDVFPHFYKMQRDPTIWGSDADDFRPERWDERKIGFEFMAFSAGPRYLL